MGLLDIARADLGYDKIGMDNAYKAIHTEIIEEVIKQMESGIETTQINMGDFWVGASADMFKRKLDVDYVKLVNSLRAIDAGLIQEFYQMMYNVNNSDATIAEDILAGTSLAGGFATSASAPTPTAAAIETASIGASIGAAAATVANGVKTVGEAAAAGAVAGASTAQTAQVKKDDEVKAIVDDNKKTTTTETTTTTTPTESNAEVQTTVTDTTAQVVETTTNPVENVTTTGDTKPSTSYTPIENFTFKENYSTTEVLRNADGSTYKIMYPENPSGPCNIVVGLSGVGSMNNTNISGGNIVNSLNNLSCDPGNTIFIVPSTLSSNWDTSGNVTNIMNEIEYVKNNYDVTGNVGVMGHSWGAKGALYLGVNYPETFQRVALFSPYDNVTGDFNNIQAGNIKVFYETVPANGGWSGQTPINFGNNQNYREMWGEENFYQVQGGHGDTPSYAMNLDSNGDGLSDLAEFFWTE